jgi:hypothetical protein
MKFCLGDYIATETFKSLHCRDWGKEDHSVDENGFYDMHTSVFYCPMSWI